LGVPVKLTAGPRAERIGFNQIHNLCGSRIKQQTFCPVCDRVVEKTELVKGYEVEKDKYVLTNDEEVKACAPPSADNIEITACVPSTQLDSMLFEGGGYYLGVDPGEKQKSNPAADKVYTLLRESLLATGTYALGKLTMFGHEHIVAIRPYQDVLSLHTLYYEDEVRATPVVAAPKLTKQEMALGKQLIETFTKDFDHSEFTDEYRVEVLKMIEAKKEGVAPTPINRKKPPTSEGDLMAKLQMSINMKAAAQPTPPAPKKRKAA
jgi:DNA end-binding protein Ku